MIHLHRLWFLLSLAALLVCLARVRANEPVELYWQDGPELIGPVEGATGHTRVREVMGTTGAGMPPGSPPQETTEPPENPTSQPPQAPAGTNGEGEQETAESAAETTTDSTLEPIPEPEELFDANGDPLLTLIEPVVGGVCGAFGQECGTALEGVAIWTQRLELGARFRDGNSEEDFINIGSKLERKDERRMLSMQFGGQYGEANGRPTENRWFGNATVDLSREGNWILFAANRNEFDEFENLDYRGTVAGGLGYRFYNEGDRRFVTRLGPGVTHQKFHAPSKVRTTADLLGELEIRWPVFDRTQFEHKTTVTPNVEDFQVFRLQSNYGIVVHLDERERWSLEFGLQHDYNSRPNVNNRPSDFMSSIRLLYQLK